jgi:hypothetical protein
MIPVIALLAAGGMLCQDIIGTILTITAAKGKAALTGALDSLGWFAAIGTTVWSVNALNGHSLSTKLWVFALVSVANFAGSYLGVKIGQKITKNKDIKVPAPQV